MKIYKVGINHYDPLCRERLLTYLQLLSTQESSLPTFIGVEWSKNLHEKIAGQRELFRNLIEKQWPTMAAETILHYFNLGGNCYS